MGIVHEGDLGGPEGKVKQWRKYIEMLEYEKIHTVVAQKDIKKGEKIRVRCKVSVPRDIYNEIVADVAKHAGHIIVPR